MKKWLSFFLISCLLLISRDVYAQATIDVKIGATRSAVVLRSEDGIFKNGEKLGNSIKITPPMVSENDFYTSPSGYMDVDGVPYRGGVRFLLSGSSLKTINVVDVEDYLRGVIPKEIGTSTPIEALKTQAVISRSFAYANWNKFAKEGYNLDDTIASQAYGGMRVESKNTDRAVFETRGEVLYYKDSIANTIFHATSGGYTESIEAVWGGNAVPYLRSMADPYSVDTRNSTWEATFDLGDIARRFSGIGTPRALHILKRTPSGRIETLKIVGSGGEKTMSGNQFRMAMGSTVLKSTNFDLKPIEVAEKKSHTVITARGTVPLDHRQKLTAKGLSPIERLTAITAKGIETLKPSSGTQGLSDYLPLASKTTFYGRGYGHGVGLSQYGAIAMAEDGMDYRAILDFYFPGTHIR